MSRHPQPRGERGSLRWIQEFVNDRPGDSGFGHRFGFRTEESRGRSNGILRLSTMTTPSIATMGLEKLDTKIEVRPFGGVLAETGAAVGCR